MLVSTPQNMYVDESSFVLRDSDPVCMLNTEHFVCESVQCARLPSANSTHAL